MPEFIISPSGYVMVPVVGGGTRFLNWRNIVSIYIEEEKMAGQHELNLIIRTTNMQADCTVPLQDMQEGLQFIQELTGINPPTGRTAFGGSLVNSPD